MRLRRELGFWAVFCISSGAMISSGLFVLPGQAFKFAGPAVIVAYALASLMVLPALLSKAEMSTAMPTSGGGYFFVERSMGALPGTLAGLAGWFSIALKSAFAMIGIGAFARLIWPDADLTDTQWEVLIKAVAVACCVVFVMLNVLSVKIAGGVQIAMVVVLLAILGLFIVAGAPHVRQHPNFDNLMQAGWEDVFATAALVFVSFGGLTKIAAIGEEVRKPERNIPRAMLLSWVAVSLVYIASVLVMVGVTDKAALGAGAYGSLTPLSLAASRFMGRGGAILLAAAAIMAFVTTGNSGILAASRSPLAMSRDNLLPRGLGKVSARFGTPAVSIVLTGGFMVAMIVLLSIPDLVKVASTMMLILFLLMNVAVLIMRGSRIRNYRPAFRAPLFPWLQLAGIATYAFLIVIMTRRMTPLPLVTTAVFLLGGTLWYVLYVRRRTTRESALVYMVRSAVSKAIYRSTLEEELKDIALDRDEITQDRFDHLIRRCGILDLPGPIDADEMFVLAASELAPRIGVAEDELLALFQQREAQSSTVIQPGLAIPHVIVEGRGLFDVLMVRCRAGVRFPGAGEPVRIGFVLVGSADERNFHLRALMAVASIVQEPHFRQRWLEAPDPEHLRDIVLLSSRPR